MNDTQSNIEMLLEALTKLNNSVDILTRITKKHETRIENLEREQVWEDKE